MNKQDHFIEDAKLASSPIEKKRKSDLRKAPQAPKRFKSSYILFFVHIQAKIKAELGRGASVRTLFSSFTFSKAKNVPFIWYHICLQF